MLTPLPFPCHASLETSPPTRPGMGGRTSRPLPPCHLPPLTPPPHQPRVERIAGAPTAALGCPGSPCLVWFSLAQFPSSPGRVGRVQANWQGLLQRLQRTGAAGSPAGGPCSRPAHCHFLVPGRDHLPEEGVTGKG